ncbi:hypothetical protein AMECASPLE_037940 [Ameca splendens]|uniref:Uncharacterized protein n=1 Tax=Ameca splendens TaxID=208324 RepID=A0ABV0Y7Y7_9TELE
MSHFPSCYGATGTYLFQDTYLYTHTYTCAYQLMPVQNGVFVHLSPPLSSQPGRCVEGFTLVLELWLSYTIIGKRNLAGQPIQSWVEVTLIKCNKFDRLCNSRNFDNLITVSCSTHLSTELGESVWEWLYDHF